MLSPVRGCQCPTDGFNRQSDGFDMYILSPIIGAASDSWC